MADQAERVILEAEDQVTPITDKANAALDGFEKKAESSHGKVIRISDQTRSSVQRLIASLEKQAETYGKSGVDRLITQRDQLLQRYNREPQAIDAITRSYEKMIAMEEKAAREALAVKAAKEAEEALRKQSEAITSFGDRVSQFMENPLQGAKGADLVRAFRPWSLWHRGHCRRCRAGHHCGVRIRGGERVSGNMARA
jgi:DNA repair exonuclease SbcCD ATPase subunit